MRKLLKRGTYNPVVNRPSQHQITERSFLVDHGGAIPPNVLVPPDGGEPLAVLPIPNTASNHPYHVACREKGLPRHPAVMPDQLVEFFVRFLTDDGDVVLDPFAGSNTTGAVAEQLGRKWVGIEANEEYAELSRVRFGAAG
jgi:site-specific DNA-methyltransferase (cytosine-N4-specific)